MSDKPEALRLADALEMSSNHGSRRKAAAELRRLFAIEAQRDELLEALKPFADTDLRNPSVSRMFGFDVLRARAAIAKATGGAA